MMRLCSILGCLALVGCQTADSIRPVHAYLGAGMAGTNNPNTATGDSDNLSLAVGARVAHREFSLRPEVHAGDHAVQFTPSLTWDFPVAGEGPGSIEGHVGLGYSWLTERENSILGNTKSPFARLGFEGSLELGLVAGAAIMVAPWGYDEDDVAVAGITYLAFRF